MIEIKELDYKGRRIHIIGIAHGKRKRIKDRVVRIGTPSKRDRERIKNYFSKNGLYPNNTVILVEPSSESDTISLGEWAYTLLFSELLRYEAANVFPPAETAAIRNHLNKKLEEVLGKKDAKLYKKFVRALRMHLLFELLLETRVGALIAKSDALSRIYNVPVMLNFRRYLKALNKLKERMPEQKFLDFLIAKSATSVARRLKEGENVVVLCGIEHAKNAAMFIEKPEAMRRYEQMLRRFGEKYRRAKRETVRRLKELMHKDKRWKKQKPRKRK